MKMANTSAILREKAFWLFYACLNDDPLEPSVLHHFGTTTISGRKYPQAVFPLPCGEIFELIITVSPGLSYIDLALWNSATDTVAEMAWWDDARWHPYALRWSELTKLHKYWINNLEPNIHPSAAFLLLARFVGNGVDEGNQFAGRKAMIRDHYEQLQLFTKPEITKLSDAFRLPSADDYNWEHDDKLGWGFRSEYSCYSLRNPEHSDGSEGRFPFSDWATVMDQL